MPGQRPVDYLLPPGLTVSAAAARAWEVLLPAHQAWKAALANQTVGDADTKFTRDRWLLPLLYELGYGRPTPLASGVDLPPGLGETKPVHFTLSHQLARPAGVAEPTAALAVHRRVRQATGVGRRGLRARALPPADVLGVYVYLPARATA